MTQLVAAIMGGVDLIELARIVDDALAAARRLPSGEEYWDLLGKTTGVGSVAADLALRMLRSNDSVVRATGCDLLGAACNGNGEPHRWAATALVDLAASETSREVVRSIAGALEHVADLSAIPLLVELASYDDSDVRRKVALALPAAMTDHCDDAAVEALIRLSRDPDAATRNWATFGLGRQVGVDSAEVREALWARTDDKDPDVREEGICGLARRRDRRMLPLVADLLAAGDAHSWLFDAAAWLGDESLVPLLEEYDVAVVERAMRECVPARVGARDVACRDLLRLVQTALDDQRPGLIAAVFCDRLDYASPFLRIGGDNDRVWFVETLLEAVNGDPAAAADRVMEQL